MRIETQILSNLLCNEAFARKAIPFLDVEYFKESHERLLLTESVNFFTKYNQLIRPDILRVQVSSAVNVPDGVMQAALQSVDEFLPTATNTEWLLAQTEEFCKRSAVYNAIVRSIKIIDGEDKQYNQDAIPSLLTDALGVSFDTAVGHEYATDAADRWEFYNRVEEKIPFDLSLMNEITQGGMAPKALYCVGAQSGGGKSLFMTHVAASTLRFGKNVLYISMEMSEEKIAERIDANLLKVDIDKLGKLSKDDFVSRIEKIQAKTHGRLFVKEYPTGSAHVGHFRALLEELKVKQNFKPDLIIVDYLGICASSRMKMGGSVNSYSYVKAIAEELRGLAVEYNVPILTGAQLNRSGFDNSDVDLTSTADSMGLVMTLDVFFALIRTDELDEQNAIMIKQLKNRYSDPGYKKKFLVGLNRPRMTFYDLEEAAQAYVMPEAINKHIPARPAPKTIAPDEPLPWESSVRRDRSKLDASNFNFGD